MGLLQVHTLRIDGLRRPQYVKQEFQFSWILESERKGCVQTGYRIQLWQGEGMIWDSGKVSSGACSGIRYAGPKLQPLQEYVWQVCCWDDYGETAAASDRFRTCRAEKPWHAHWVQPVQKATVPERPAPFEYANRAEEQPRDYKEFQPVQLVRSSIEIEKEVRCAFVHVSAHGLYHLELNGEAVGNDLFAPECTPYDKLIFYQSYDVTRRLKAGKNIFGVALADGWWIGRLGLGSWNCQYGDKKDLFLECEVLFEDGSRAYFGAEKAKAAPSRGSYADLFVGEKYDASAVPEGWSLPEFDDTLWQPVLVTDMPLETLQPQTGQSVRIVKEWEPLAVLRTPNGDTVVDAGQNLAGFLRITLDTGAGCEIVLEYSETLDENGNFFNNIKGVNKDQRDVYITRDGKQSWQPAFTYHGFRYVRINGWPGELSCDQLRVCAVSSEDDFTGDFACSDERLNQLQHNIIWSQISNMVSIPTDCPQREKVGWTGDLTVYAPTMLYLSSAEWFLRRWLKYLRAEQFENGLVPVTAPYWKICREMSRLLGSDTSCGWGDAIVFVPWAIYQETGNQVVLEENYDAMRRWMSYVEREDKNGSWNQGFHFGDWMLPSIIMAGGTPRDTAYATKELFSTAYYAYSAKIMAQIAAALGRLADEKKYERLYQDIRQAFAEKYVRADGSLPLPYQGAYVVSLKFGLIPESKRAGAVNHLCRLIEENGTRLDTGFLSVPFLLDVLCENRHRDLAMRLLFQTECPSWLYMVEHGATTIWESWDCISPEGKVGSYSYNHYAFGCVGDWLYREIAGVQNLEPGYRRVRLCPGIDSGLSWARTSHRTPQGWLAFEWHKEGGKIQVKAEIPIGTAAELGLPGQKSVTVGSGQYEFVWGV